MVKYSCPKTASHESLPVTQAPATSHLDPLSESQGLGRKVVGWISPKDVCLTIWMSCTKHHQGFSITYTYYCHHIQIQGCRAEGIQSFVCLCICAQHTWTLIKTTHLQTARVGNGTGLHNSHTEVCMCKVIWNSEKNIYEAGVWPSG